MRDVEQLVIRDRLMLAVVLVDAGLLREQRSKWAYYRLVQGRWTRWSGSPRPPVC